MTKMNEIHAVGRRKTSIARVYMFSGKEKGVIVNKTPLEEYFKESEALIKDILRPFDVLGKQNSNLIKVNVKGGGKTGQAGAIRLGIARVLAQLDEKSRKILRANGLLTRDARMVERKKVGKHKARKSDQYSKR